MEATTLGALANLTTERFGDREFLCFQGARWSFTETQVEIAKVARGLIGLGIRPGEKVSLWMTNRPEWVHIMFALAKIGAIMVPINTRLRTDDVEYIFRQSDTSTIITIEQSGPIRYLDMVLDLCPELKEQDRRELSCEAFPELKRVLSIGDQHAMGVYSWQEMLDASDEVSAATLRERRLGRVLLLEAGAEEERLRSLAALDLDLLLLSDVGEALTVRDQLALRRIVELTRKPLMAQLSGEVSTTTLEVWRDSGLPAVLVPASPAGLLASVVAAAAEVAPPPEPLSDDRPDAMLPAMSSAPADDDFDDDD